MENIAIKITDLERIMREWGAIPGDWRHFFADIEKASIQDAPDWSNAPEKANFYAEDENGMGYWENSVLDPDDPWADCQDYQENPLPAIKAALEQSQALLDNLIQHIDDLIPDQIETARQFIEINAECHCDCYNGFDCGCAQYNFIRTEGLNALAVKIQNQ